MAHKFKQADYEVRKVAHANAKAQQAAAPNSVPALRELVTSVMDALGMRK